MYSANYVRVISAQKFYLNAHVVDLLREQAVGQSAIGGRVVRVSEGSRSVVRVEQSDTWVAVWSASRTESEA